MAVAVAPVVASLRVLHINIYEIKSIAIVNIVWCAAMSVCVLAYVGCNVRACVRPCLPKDSVKLGFNLGRILFLIIIILTLSNVESNG